MLELQAAISGKISVLIPIILCKNATESFLPSIIGPSVMVMVAKKAHRNRTTTQPVKKPSEKTIAQLISAGCLLCIVLHPGQLYAYRTRCRTWGSATK